MPLFTKHYGQRSDVWSPMQTNIFVSE